MHTVHRSSLLQHMLHIAWSVCLYVSHMDVLVLCKKITEPIEMPFGGWLVGPRNHALHEVKIHPQKYTILGVVHCPAQWKHCKSLLGCMQQKGSFNHQ